MRKSKNRYFYHIFVSPGDPPGAIILNVVWMEREFDAYKLSRSMYPSMFNSFPMQLFEPQVQKIAVFTYRSPRFCFPWSSQHVAYLSIFSELYVSELLFPSYTMLKSKNRYFYHIFVSPGDAPGAITLNVVWMER